MDTRQRIERAAVRRAARAGARWLPSKRRRACAAAAAVLALLATGCAQGPAGGTDGAGTAGGTSAAPPAVAAAASPAPAAVAKAAVLYQGADLALGERLIAEHRCEACHARKVGGDGSSIYRPRGRIANPALLRGMVEQCNTELNLGLFPDEVNSVAAVVNRDHYRFP